MSNTLTDRLAPHHMYICLSTRVCVRRAEQEAYEMPDGDMSGIEEERAEAEKEVEESKAIEQKTPW